jgi:trans-aconitate methyltransferase
MAEDPKAVVARGYDAMVERYASWASAIPDVARDRMTAELERRLPPGSSLVDLGCGAGLPSTARLAQRYAVTGVDGSARQVEAARRNVPGATFLVADMAELALPPRSVDAVTAFYSVSHLPRATHAQLFQRVATWLKPHGLFLATLGAHDSPDWWGEWLGVEMFFSSYDAETNRGLVEAAGFDVVIAQVLGTPEPEGTTEFLWLLARAPGEPAPGA